MPAVTRHVTILYLVVLISATFTGGALVLGMLLRGMR